MTACPFRLLQNKLFLRIKILFFPFAACSKPSLLLYLHFRYSKSDGIFMKLFENLKN